MGCASVLMLQYLPAQVVLHGCVHLLAPGLRTAHTAGSGPRCCLVCRPTTTTAPACLCQSEQGRHMGACCCRWQLERQDVLQKRAEQRDSLQVWV